MVQKTETKEEHEDPPGPRPPHLWEDLLWERWNDRRWQLSHRLNTAGDFARVIHFAPEEKRALSALGHFRVDVTPYFATVMDSDEPTCPIRRQVIPTLCELFPFEAEMADSLAEDAHSPVPGLVHRYPDRVLMLVTIQCASYGRYCIRGRMVGDPHDPFRSADYECQLAYIVATPQMRDMLLSGGGPLEKKQRILGRLLTRVRAIPHIEIMEVLRGHTSGYAIPAYVIDPPDGGGEVPLLPNYLLGMSDSRVSEFGQVGGNGSNGHQPELDIPALLNTEGER